jgi:hypothetical protein
VTVHTKACLDYLQCSTNTSLTFQKTNGIGRPGRVTVFSSSYQATSNICQHCNAVIFIKELGAWDLLYRQSKFIYYSNGFRDNFGAFSSHWKSRNLEIERSFTIPVAKNASSPIPIDVYSLSGNYKARMVVLKSNRIRVITPIVEIVRKLEEILSLSALLQNILSTREESYRPNAIPLHRDIE